MMQSITRTPSGSKSLFAISIHDKRLVVFAFVFAFTTAVTNFGLSALMLGPSQVVDDQAGEASDSSTTAAGNHSNPTPAPRSIKDFPAFMLQWPTDPFEPDECDILNTSTPHVFGFTDYPKSYSLDDVFLVDNGNLTAAWNQVGTIPANGKTSHNQVETVVCNTIDDVVKWHFPHLMQSLMACWSFWRHFPDAHHVLRVEGRNRSKFVTKSRYNKGLFSLLQTTNITIRQGDDVLKEKPQDPQNSPITVRANVTLTNGYRLASEGDAQDLRHKVLTMLDMNHLTGKSCAGVSSSNEKGMSSTGSTANGDSDASHGANQHQAGIPRITIVSRRSSRRMRGAHNISARLQEELDLPYAPPVVFFEKLRFEQQVETFATTDILLTPHGAQMVSIPFMPPCSSVVEVFPRNYDWKEFFGTLAALSGVNHSYVYLGEDPAGETQSILGTKQERLSRDVMLCPPMDPIVKAVKIQVDQWQRCCGFTN